MVVRRCEGNMGGMFTNTCEEETQGSTTVEKCYCATDLCNSSNSIGILNILFFGSLALFCVMN